MSSQISPTPAGVNRYDPWVRSLTTLATVFGDAELDLRRLVDDTKTPIDIAHLCEQLEGTLGLLRTTIHAATAGRLLPID